MFVSLVLDDGLKGKGRSSVSQTNLITNKIVFQGDIIGGLWY